MVPFFDYLLLLLLKVLVLLLDLATDALLGRTLTGGYSGERAEAANYESSAHLVSVAWRAKLASFFPTQLGDFLLLHRAYVHPRTILERKNITLFFVTKEEAVFCVSEETDDVYDMDLHPFAAVAQYERARELVVVPKWAFHRLAEEVGDPKVKVRASNLPKHLRGATVSAVAPTAVVNGATTTTVAKEITAAATAAGAIVL